MQLAPLQVVHLKKGPVPLQSVPSFPGALFLNSCQRYLWISNGELPEVISSPDAQVFGGTEAYEFLLRVACGLESEIPGETEIFGQLKDAWKKSDCIDPVVDYWVQKIFEDTKEVRSRHLENMGGVSYGSLVRRYFGGREASGPVLLVGAGQLAESVAPYLISEGQELWILNRSAEKAADLCAALLSRQGARQGAQQPGARVRIVSDAEAWSAAARIVVCIPVTRDDARNVARIGAETEVLHLGARRDEAGAWASLAGAGFLDDLFILQKAQGEARSIQLHRAERACDERAKLRGLGGGMSTAHGWEDLAVFAL